MVSKKLIRKQRQRRIQRIRAKVFGTPQRPRLCVSRSLTNVYTQIIDDTKGHVLAAANFKDIDGKGASKMEQAQKVGELIAQKAREKNIQRVVFDRRGRKYHGKIKAVAEGARKGGLEF